MITRNADISWLASWTLTDTIVTTSQKPKPHIFFGSTSQGWVVCNGRDEELNTAARKWAGYPEGSTHIMMAPLHD